MTNREFFATIASTETLSAGVREFAAEQISKLDKRNASAKSKTAEKASSEYAPLIAQMTALLSGREGVTLTSECAAGVSLNSSKAVAVLHKMEAAGTVASFDVKVKGKGVQKAWKLIAPTAEVTAD